MRHPLVLRHQLPTTQRLHQQSSLLRRNALPGLEHFSGNGLRNAPAPNLRQIYLGVTSPAEHGMDMRVGDRRHDQSVASQVHQGRGRALGVRA
jgi:hypothetical protein